MKVRHIANSCHPTSLGGILANTCPMMMLLLTFKTKVAPVFEPNHPHQQRQLPQLVRTIFHSILGSAIIASGAVIFSLPYLANPGEPPIGQIAIYTTLGTIIIAYGGKWIVTKSWGFGSQTSTEARLQTLENEVTSIRTTTSDLKSQMDLVLQTAQRINERQEQLLSLLTGKENPSPNIYHQDETQNSRKT
jgi:hypothetical protein